jgi:hypothetical protein
MPSRQSVGKLAMRRRLNWSICNRAPNYRVKKPNTIVIPLDTIDQLASAVRPHHFANGDCEKKRNNF